MIVYIVWHIRDIGDGLMTYKEIGTFSTEQNAKNAIVAVGDQPGFIDYPDGFKIETWTVDHLAWPDGFITIRD